MRTFDGRRVAVLEGRKRHELAAMVRRLGGVAICAPAVRERPVDGGAPVIERVIDRSFDLAVVLTGAGASALFDQAERLGSLTEVVVAMEAMTIACRGPKPLNVLRRHGILPDLVTAKPHTSNELLDALHSIDLDGATLMLLHYGERNEQLATALAARGAIVEDVCLYEWALPLDIAPLEELVRRITSGDVDAVLFTSQIQFRFLMQVAGEMGGAAGLVRALNEQAIVGAVGPVCADALRAGGVVPDVLPASANSASLVAAVADYFALTTSDERR